MNDAYKQRAISALARKAQSSQLENITPIPVKPIAPTHQHVTVEVRPQRQFSISETHLKWACAGLAIVFGGLTMLILAFGVAVSDIKRADNPAPNLGTKEVPKPYSPTSCWDATKIRTVFHISAKKATVHLSALLLINCEIGGKEK